jgi:hypothetical protein
MAETFHFDIKHLVFALAFGLLGTIMGYFFGIVFYITVYTTQAFNYTIVHPVALSVSSFPLLSAITFGALGFFGGWLYSVTRDQSKQ